MTSAAPTRREARAEAGCRRTLSSLQGLLALALVLGDDRSEDEVIHLAATAVPSLGPCRVEGVLHTGLGWRATTGACAHPGPRARIQAELARAGPGGGPLAVPDRAWGWALPLRGRSEQVGHLVVTADREPSDAELHVLRALAAHAGVSLASARARGRERSEADRLRAANADLAETVAALRRRTAVQDRLLEVAVAGEGRAGIARALSELTGLAAAVEDADGNVLAHAGPPGTPPAERPTPGGRAGPPRAGPARESAARVGTRAVRRALAAGRPVRADGRILAAARQDGHVLGVLALADPDARAGDAEVAALEHAAAVLTLELARLAGVADAELRLGRDLVADLVDGVEVDAAVERAHAAGHDLRRAHRVLVLDGAGDPAALLAAARQAVRDHRGSPLVLPRDGGVVAVSADAPGDPDRWERFRAVVLAGPGVRGCRLGVGGVAIRPADYPRSHHEAVCALRLHEIAGGPDRAVRYDELGVYQLLCEIADTEGVGRFVRTWLGALIDYDRAHRTELVATVARFLECGGSYDATAAAMALGRSTVRYRLRRIRQISGHDLAVPDTRFNLQLATRALAAQRVV